MTQPEFAAAAGAAKRTLIEWEKGATAPTAVQLSALGIVGVDLLYVLTGVKTATHSMLAALKLGTEFGMLASSISGDKESAHAIQEAVLQQYRTQILSEEEQTLVNNYRNLEAEAQVVLMKISTLFPQQKVTKDT